MIVRTRSAADKISSDSLLVSLELFGSEVTALVVGALDGCWRGIRVSGVASNGRSADETCARGGGGGSTERPCRLA